MVNIHAKYNTRSLFFGNENMVSFFCVFGKEGISNNKIEGDWKTPIGTFPIRKIYFRKDKMDSLDTKIETIPISKEDAWCDDINKKEYNTFVKLPFNGNYENLWREDDMYDIVIILGYNNSPILKNKGSAIFIHIAKDGMEYTKGCLAIKKEDMLKLINKITPETKINISL